MKVEEVVVVAAQRTPTGKFWGGLATETALSMTTKLVQQTLSQNKIAADQIDQVILGNVLAAGNKQNLARQVQLRAQLPQHGTALTINQVCGSGLKAVRLAQSALLLGDAQVVLAGGVESMSHAPGLVERLDKQNFAQEQIQDSLWIDGLNDAFQGYPMGQTAENLVAKYHWTRQQQDAYALRSQQLAAQAQKEGAFSAEILAINELSEDETLRPSTTLVGLSQLPPAFSPEGSVTAGNSSPLSDAAAVVLLTTASYAQRQGWQPLARLVAYQESGYCPELMGYTPVLAIRQLLQKQKQTVADIDLFEVNEAFSAQALTVLKELDIPEDCYNPVGGALALGHALGASGARILTTLVHQLQQQKKQRGIAALCIGGGQAVAMEVEAL
ncbi:thiolase family protein [Lactobacillus sp. DCY120]|uniref:acetyl-CoA C-acetyltransferase n=1 Tax=Bombilactobacillus apium TaxID=2675299 RepID=A0A850RBR4_9LACO|nr:acetyl-CoA C-acyltransferase [Bombilactobacillus apium]NVY96756.1 thiolase family protein [Bombilactobacillus apium]